MSASLGLYRLQQVDRQIDRARTQLDIIHKTLENDAELRDALAEVEQAQADHHHARHALKNAEAETQAQKGKIEQAESSLYGGRVQNPKELQDLQKDVASLKKHLVTLEERELESMLAAETAETALNTARENLEQLQARRGNEHKKLLDDQAAHVRDLERLSDEREASVNPIESSMLAIYDDLRKQKRGVAVTDFSENTCAACGSALNASVQQNAKSSKQLAYCPTCGRILYAS
jgi:predicted  nucleic acid-binding Zn-ribbon protein